MKPKQVMIVAGEASGDMLAAELVSTLRQELTATQIAYTPEGQPLRTGLEPRFFGAGGPRMKAAGVELAFDLTAHSVIGVVDVVKDILKFRRLLKHLRDLAIRRQPDVIICVDYSGFNRRLAKAIKGYTRKHSDWFHGWQPRIIQYVSPQVWASREGRAYQIARDYDLLLSIFPFEKEWYARRVPQFKVEFVGHPLVERYRKNGERKARIEGGPSIVLLPGSRPRELKHHLPVVAGAVKLIRKAIPDSRVSLVLPNEFLAQLAKLIGLPTDVIVRVGGMQEALADADLAIAKTGTVTMECAFFGVPAVTFYKTSWRDYQIGKRLVKVTTLTMPNLMAKEEVFPEFIQNDATPENLSRAALDLLRDQNRRDKVKARLAEIVNTLGGPGASRRAAQAIVRCLAERKT